MKNKTLHLIFGIIFLTELVSIQFHLQTLEYFAKPAILIYIILLFISLGNKESSIYKRAIAAFSFSLLGDVLLMFSHSNELFFLTGVAAFLTSHVFFILTFTTHKAKNQSLLRQKKWIALPVIICGASLYVLLFNHLDLVLKAAVFFYTSAIALMVLTAINRYGKVNKQSFRWVLAGALLFLASDSVLAINRFWIDIPLSGILNMTTYMLAQYFILLGLLNEHSQQ